MNGSPAGRVWLTNTEPALRRAWHPVARSAEVTEQPRRVLLLGQPYVLYRAGGRPRCFVDRCPHRLAPLSLGSCSGGVLSCAYHGWRFDPEGRCVAVPALGEGAALPPRARLTAVAGVEERHGMVFVAPEPPVAPLGTVAESSDPAFSTGELPPISARASAGLLADNFLDMAHFPFVHAGTFGADEAAEVPAYEVARDGWSFVARREHQFANREDPGVAAGVRPLLQRRRLTYRLDAPFHLQLRIDFLDAGGTNVIGFFLQPETADRCRIYTTLWRNDLPDEEAALAAAVAFEEAVLAEDLAVQEAYDRLALPLDPTVELHTRADRSSVELRRVLADLVRAAGEETAPQEPLNTMVKGASGGV
jgi:phenylpropionate dioxygenase-like ring-hydroxylating dioxygenase large terminal subunit